LHLGCQPVVICIDYAVPCQEHWSKVVRAAGGLAVHRLGWEWEQRGNGLSVIISEPEPGQFIANKAKKLKRPLLSTEWLYQCILAGKILDHKAHEEYNLV
jgi:hypothetical protein